jgi:hypothetical protein
MVTIQACNGEEIFLVRVKKTVRSVLTNQTKLRRRNEIRLGKGASINFLQIRIIFNIKYS